MSWLVTGGAGYIGAHVVRALQDAGERVVVVDDLSTGDAIRLDGTVPFVSGSIHDTGLLVRVMTAYGVDGVVHLAGRKSVAESIRHPLDYQHHNVHGLHSVLTAMVSSGHRADPVLVQCRGLRSGHGGFGHRGLADRAGLAVRLDQACGRASAARHRGRGRNRLGGAAVLQRRRRGRP